MTNNERNVVITVDPREIKVKTVKGVIAFFVIFIILVVGAFGGVYHHEFKPKLEQMLEIVANVKDGEQGEKGTDGISIASAIIDNNGNLILTYNTGTIVNLGKIIGEKGDTGENGQDGQNGYTPYIGSNGDWWINNQDTGILAKGIQGPKGDTGEQGIQGLTGEAGKDGTTPHIGENGNWFIGDTDTGYLAGIKITSKTGDIYNYTRTGSCDEGGVESYINGEGELVLEEFDPGEHKWDDASHSCLRDDSLIKFKNEEVEIAICGDTACIWPAEDSNGILSFGNYQSFSNIFNAVKLLGTAVEKVIIKEGITEIASNAFRDCEDLTEVEFNDEIQYIGSHAFDGTNIKVFNLPGTVTYTGEDALNPYIVESINVLENKIDPTKHAKITCICYHYIDQDEESETYGQEKWQNMNYYKTNGKYANLTSLEFFGKVDVGYMGFRGCEAIETVIFHDESTIGSWAFQGCISMTTLDLTGVTSLGEVAVQCCESLETLYIPATLTSMQKWVFDGSCNLTDIYIEHESKPEGWHNEWPGTINFCYQPKTPTAANWTRYFDNTKTNIHWGVSEENPEGTTTEIHS